MDGQTDRQANRQTDRMVQHVHLLQSYKTGMVALAGLTVIMFVKAATCLRLSCSEFRCGASAPHFQHCKSPGKSGYGGPEDEGAIGGYLAFP